MVGGVWLGDAADVECKPMHLSDLAIDEGEQFQRAPLDHPALLYVREQAPHACRLSNGDNGRVSPSNDVVDSGVGGGEVVVDEYELGEVIDARDDPVLGVHYQLEQLGHLLCLVQGFDLLTNIDDNVLNLTSLAD